MSTPEQDRQRLGKFLGRMERIHKEDAIAKMGNAAFQMQISMGIDPGSGEQIVSLELPSVPETDLWACIARCRVFFTVSEDCYLPKVVTSLYAVAPRSKRPRLKELMGIVKGFVVDGNLVGATSYSGRLESDNGLGEGKLLGNDQTCMDYIYGVVLHEDEPRRARLQNVVSLGSLEHDVLVMLARLISLATLVRDQIRLGQENDWLPDFPDSFWLG